MDPALDFELFDLLVERIRPAFRTLGLGLHFLGIVSPPQKLLYVVFYIKIILHLVQKGNEEDL